VSDEPVRHQNGDKVGVREWAEARQRDTSQVRRDIEASVVGSEERMMAALAAVRERTLEQDKRIDGHHERIDKIESLLDQQRGARNLIIAMLGVNIAGWVGLLAVIVRSGGL
jgi:hypothetical protein